MPIYKVEAPDGRVLKIEGPEGASEQDILSIASQLYQPEDIKPDTGFTGAFSAGKERLKGDIAALAGRVGIMDTEKAEQYKREKDILAERMFTPTEKGFSEAPFLKFRELLGGSLPYAAAPLIAGVGAAALPAAGVAVPVATGIGLAGAGLASLGQFTGSNLSRQMQEDPNLKLADTNLASAAAAAAPQAALDIVSFRMIPGIGKVFGAAGKEITPEIAKRIAEQGILKTTGAYGAGALKTAGIEGTTEAGQQFFERLQAGLNLTDQKARDEYFDSFIGGAVLGGTLGVPGTYIERGRTIRQGAEMEQEEKRQAIIDRQKEQQEGALAEQRQLQQTSENLGVKSTLLLPPPDKRLEVMEEVDPLIDPLGRFKSTDLSPKEVAEINRRRVEMGKPRIGRTFSIEDLADVFKPEESVAADGVLNRLIASRTGYTADQNIPAQTLEVAAQQHGIDSSTQGFRDFLVRTTGTDDINAMSPPQRLAVAQAIQKVQPGDETRILEAGLTNAKYYTPDQYNDTVKGLSKEFKEVGDQEYGRSSVLKQIEKYSGLKQEKDQQRLLDQAVKDGFLERSVKPGTSGSMVELFKPSTTVQPLPGGMDIRKETFKQGEVPEAYELRAGARVLSTRGTQEEANRAAVAFEQNRQAEIVRLEKEVQKLQREVVKRNAELTKMQALGQDQSGEFFIKSADYYRQDQVANTSIADLRQKQQGFADPVQIVPVGTKPVAKDSFTFYEKDEPQVKFDTEEQAEQYGISRLNDETLQQIIESAASQKQTGRVKRYVNFAQKELNERQSTKGDRGITIKTKQGEKGGKERLEKLGIYSNEAQQNVEKIRQTLLPALKRFGLERVALRLVDSIENGTADGYYVKEIMAIAMDSKNPMGTLRHESIHALKELGAFTDQEWKVLTNKAKSEYVQKYIKDTGLYDAYKNRYQAENKNLTGFEEYINEEAIAEAFRNFKPGNLPAGMIGNIWVRLNKMFEALRNSFQRLGFQTADNIFSRVEEGKQRPTKVASSEEAKLAIKPDNDYEIVRKAQPRGRTTDQVSYELRRKSDNKLVREFDNKKEAQQMLDVYTLPQEEVFAKYPELKPAEKPKASLRKTSSLENALDFARKNDFKRNRDLKVALQDQVLAAAEKENIDLTSTDEETTEYLTKSVADDAIYALKSNANAVGWYDITVAKALNVVSLMHPEIKTDPNAKFAFTWALAVTSNGMKVDKNFELAEQAYNAYKKTGKMPTNIKAGETQKSINKSLELFNSMIEKYGINDMRKFMATEFTVKQIESLTNLKVGGEFADTRVLGAAILGPKIGNGFFSNLNGIFDQLTMDRWLMRTWGRLTGSLIEDNARLTDTKRGEMERLINGLLKPSARPTRERFEQITGKTITEADVASADAIDALATAVNKASIKPLNRTFFNKSQIGTLMRKTSNSLVGYIDGQKEAPTGPAERNFIREVFSGALDSVRKRGYPNMTMSDLQALLWYPERRLYDIAKESNISEGYKDDEAPDYTNAASKLVRSNGIPESKIKTVIANTEKEYENRARAVQRDAGKYPSQVGSEGRAAGFAGKERSHFITRGIIRSYRERNETSPNAYKGNGGKDGKGFRVLGQKAVAEFKPVIGFKNALAKADVNVPTFYELDPSGAVVFRKSISKVKEESPFGAAVFVYPDEEYANMRTFLTNDGKAGFALKGNDIVSVFSKEPHVGGVNGIMQLAVQEGGRRLDAFDTVLPDLYYNNGFKTVARLDWNNEFQPEGWNKEMFKQFNNGQPDVVFMVYDPEYNKRPTNTDGEKINEYDQGIDEQAKAIAKGAKLSFRRFEPTKPAERPSTVGGGIVLGNKQSDSSSFEGIHYSNAEQKTLNGNRYGDGIKGAEAFRLSQTDDPRIKKRVYFYIENAETGRIQPKEAGLGNYVHKQKFDNILAPSDRMTELYRLANKDFNQFESAVIEAGYDGYAVPDMGMMVILDHNTPVNYEGTVQELAEKGIKYSLRNDLNKNGIAITSRQDAEKRFSNGERIYLFPEQDEDPFLARNISELNAYPPDSMMALPSKKLRPFKQNQIKSAFNVAPTESPDIRLSLRSQLSDRLNERIGATTSKRKEVGFVERLMDAISPTAITVFRQALINKYESIELLSRLRGEKFGDDQLLAETSAIAAALQSDRAAGVAASSFKDGIPVYDKGYTFVSDMDGKVKGLIPILEPLMKYNDPYIFQTFQFYAGTRRGRRLDAEGREKTFTKEDIAAGKELEVQFPEFATVFDDYQKYNQGLVKYMMDTGVISAEEAKIWTQNWDYIPFYRQIEGERTAGPKVFSPIAGVAKPKKLKGSEAPLDDFMETIIRNARAAIEAGMKNEAARRVVRDVVDFGLGEKLSGVQSGNDIVTVKERGQTVYYRVADPLLVESLKGLNLPQLPFMSFLSAPADLLRNFVTKDPGFILANLGRDSMQAWITSGTNMTPLVDTFKQFGKGLLSHSPEAYALAKAGLTGYDFAGDVESTAKKVEQELRKRTGNRTRKEVALLPITAFWDKLGEASTASDMATRAEVYKRTLERTGSEAEAFYQAMEVINFSRKGNSALIRILSATIPFFNARVQGLDVLYRTGFGKAAMENKETIQKAFIFRSMVLLGTSAMYWAMVSDDEDYKRLSEEERDNYWIIPGLRVGDKPFRFPIPFELGVLFKVLPERVLEYSFGTDTGKDLRKSLTRNAMSTLSFNPIPQAVLPIVENVTNYSFFTGESVVGRGVEGLAPKFQYGAGTSELAKQMGESLNYSPQKIDNFIRGYTGTLGTYAMMMLDSALEQEGDPPRATKRMEQLPIIKRFFASNTGTVSAYYDMKEEVDTVVTTVNMLQRTGNSEDLKAYLEENKNLYGLKSYVNTLDKNMKQLNQATRLINSSKTMSSDDKREALDKINDAKIKLTERVKTLRKGYE